MSELRLNVIDARAVINGVVHGSVVDAVIASLSAEPETVAELEVSFGRFSNADQTPFASFRSGEDARPWDAGIVIVDLAARIIASESTYSNPAAQGDFMYHDGNQATDVCLPYRLPNDWLILYSLFEYEAIRESRRDERVQQLRINIREVLYGKLMNEYIARECLAGKDGLVSEAWPEVVSQIDGYSKTEYGESLESDVTPVQRIHGRWLMTARADLGGRSPRDVILEKLNFIDFDLQSRELQWSMLGECPPALPRSSQAYLGGGFGTHEYVVYYNFVRYLVGECWDRISDYRSCEAGNAELEHTRKVDAPSAQPTKLAEDLSRPAVSTDAMARFLQETGEAWLNSPCEELGGRIPIAIIESERRRIPLIISAKEVLFDDCPLCEMLAEDMGETLGPGFFHFDGSNMDPLFEFSTYLTREEWEAEERRWEEFNEEFARQWAKDHPLSEAPGGEPDGDDLPS